MKLLITYSWYPWNHPGTYRWLNFGRYIDFDVLTSKRPRKALYDSTIPKPMARTFRFGSNSFAFCWGLRSLIYCVRTRYDIYIFTIPPETLILSAFVLEKIFRKKVLVDMRDPIKRSSQRLKFMVPIYKFFYSRIANVIVAWQLIDPNKKCIYHGYDS